MQGWQTRPIGEVFRVVNGGTPKTGTSAYWDGPHQWITPAEMGGLPSPYLAESRRTLTDEGLRGGAELVPPKSVILSSRAPIGYLVINEVPMAFNQGCKGLVPSPAVETKFAYYFLLANVPLLESLGTGATFKELSSGKLKEVPFHFPTLLEQRRIVAILDEAFEAIATAKTNTEKSLQIARELLGRYLATVFGAPGSGWETRALGEAVRFIDYRGKTPPKREEGIRLITAKNVKMGFIQREPEEFIDPGVYDGWMTRGLPRSGDVLFTTEAPLGNVAQLDTDEKVVIGQRLITMQPQDAALDRTFLKYALISPPIQASIHAKATGATVLGIKASLLKTVQIWYPKARAEQLRLVGLISAVEDEASVLRSLASRKLSAIDELKKSLLHQAFTGQLTAKSADQQLEAVA